MLAFFLPQKRSLGHRLGKALYIIAGINAFNPVAWSFFAFPAVCGLGGLYLRYRDYVEDPEAVAEYRRDIASRPLSSTIVRFGAGIFNCASVAEVRERFEQEMGAQPRMSRVVPLYDDKHIKILRDRGVLLRSVLAEGLRLDIVETGTFSGLWHALNGRLPSFIDMGVSVDHDGLRQMLFDEFAWVDEAGGLATAATPDTTRPPPGAVGVWSAVHSYHRYVVERFNVSKSFLATVLRTCPFANEANMKALVQNHLVSLYSAGLVDQGWVQYKFDAEVNRGLDLWRADAEFNISDLLRVGLISQRSESVRALFARAVPTGARDFSFRGVLCALASSADEDRGDSLSPRDRARTNIVDFAAFWDSTLRDCPEVLPAHYRSAMADACASYQQACERVAADDSRAARSSETFSQRKRDCDEKRRQAKSAAQQQFSRAIASSV